MKKITPTQRKSAIREHYRKLGQIMTPKKLAACRRQCKHMQAIRKANFAKQGKS